MGDLPVEHWHQKISIPEMPYEAEADIIRHLTQLANLFYSLYAATPDVVDLVPEMLDTLLNFRHFLGLDPCVNDSLSPDGYRSLTRYRAHYRRKPVNP